MKIGLIGLGDIAQKAYLPVISNKADIELVLCTRNKQVLESLSKQYKVKNTAESVEELIKEKVDAAFIHSATEVHVEIAKKLLNNGVHVYVDKPMAYSLKDSQEMVKLAEENKRILMVGFNRRFAPMYKSLSEQPDRNLIIMQKNRTLNPDNIRRYIFDDFIHVVDTLRFLMPGEVENINVQGLKKDNKLYIVTLQLSNKECTAVGIMNRDSGITEEVLEVINPGNKWVVNDMVTTNHYSSGEEKIVKFKDWDSTLYKRGFYSVVDHFLACVKNNEKPLPAVEDSLKTHELCEKIVEALEKL
ncbi:Gfo/Idh/MocA family oxidoreductase [Clostridium swellfunianum]|uniref:Gfo/Idh/MocA family protein n=1 Tax=Clostridium swellfunianum TaxID=1367462 RepID=UPI0020302392|nr:Gfo/Idh/MocA family oxidoreductase [Clostridium swellfunianum]MCM0648180.1 Gfo/Idh/MocA family oxidoreductase [Clostridium swellfunianum]